MEVKSYTAKERHKREYEWRARDDCGSLIEIIAAVIFVHVRPKSMSMYRDQAI